MRANEKLMKTIEKSMKTIEKSLPPSPSLSSSSKTSRFLLNWRAEGSKPRTCHAKKEGSHRKVLMQPGKKNRKMKIMKIVKHMKEKPMEKQGKWMFEKQWKCEENARKTSRKTRKLNEKNRKSEENERKTSPKRNPKKNPQTKKK